MFVGGKGGVGKTTCAAAYAVASARTGRRVLVVSTDPAHSLGDALGVRLSSRVATIRGSKGRLRAVELDAPRAFARWLHEHGGALGDILEHGTWLDREDVDSLLGLPIPGVDELVGMIEIARLAARETKETVDHLIVVDTAPTGHALHLLAAPELVGSVASVLDDLHHEYRLVREQFARVGRPEAADHLIGLLAAQARATSTLLRDANRTMFSWVMLPERLALAETEDALRTLDAAGMNVSTLVVNRVLPGGPRCPICDRRRAEERGVIAATERMVRRRRTIRTIGAQPREPRGVLRLEPIGKRLLDHARPAPLVRPKGSRQTAPAVSVFAGDTKSRLSIANFRETRLMFVGGKGGVGKTTIASAIATVMAREQPARRVLLLSTDPAHSLGDVFDAAAGDEGTTVSGGPPNLRIREIDAAAALAARRNSLHAAFQEIAATVGAEGVEPLGAGGAGRLIDLAPPGIDELFGLLSVVDSFTTDPEVLLVVDTAPTGHALRLLELPDEARKWVQALLRILLKYRNVARPGQLAADLVDLSKSIHALQDLIRDPSRTQFIVVARAAEVPRLETVRLLERLKRLRLGVRTTIVNALTLAPGRCPICRAAAAAERRELAQLTRGCRRVFRDCAIIQTPLQAPPPRGAQPLERWARTWTR